MLFATQQEVTNTNFKLCALVCSCGPTSHCYFHFYFWSLTTGEFEKLFMNPCESYHLLWFGWQCWEEGKKQFPELVRINQQYGIKYSVNIAREILKGRTSQYVNLQAGSSYVRQCWHCSWIQVNGSTDDGFQHLGSGRVGIWIFRNYNPKWPNVQF
jgi:hypothetical protein